MSRKFESIDIGNRKPFFGRIIKPDSLQFICSLHSLTWPLDIGKYSLYIPCMGKIYAGNGWLIKVFGNEHPPMHVHVVHPDGKALIYLDGTVRNRCVPITVITQAIAWISANHEAIRAEWARLDNPERGQP